MKRIAKVVVLVLALCMLVGCGKTNSANIKDANGDGKLTCTLEVRCDTLHRKPPFFLLTSCCTERTHPLPDVLLQPTHKTPALLPANPFRHR